MRQSRGSSHGARVTATASAWSGPSGNLAVMSDVAEPLWLTLLPRVLFWSGVVSVLGGLAISVRARSGGGRASGHAPAHAPAAAQVAAARALEVFPDSAVMARTAVSTSAGAAAAEPEAEPELPPGEAAAPAGPALPLEPDPDAFAALQARLAAARAAREAGGTSPLQAWDRLTSGAAESAAALRAELERRADWSRAEEEQHRRSRKLLAGGGAVRVGGGEPAAQAPAPEAAAPAPDAPQAAPAPAPLPEVPASSGPNQDPAAGAPDPAAGHAGELAQPATAPVTASVRRLQAVHPELGEELGTTLAGLRERLAAGRADEAWRAELRALRAQLRLAEELCLILELAAAAPGPTALEQEWVRRRERLAGSGQPTSEEGS